MINERISNVTAAPSDAAAIIEATREMQAGPIDFERGDHNAATFIATSDRVKIHDLKTWLDARRPTPERVKGAATLASLDSFIAHARRFGAKERGAVFVVSDPKAPRMVSVLNYHTNADAPQWCDHTGAYAFPLSRAWKAWAERAGKPMSQEDFAAFLEDRAHEVADPKTPGVKDAVAALARLDLRVASPAEVLTASRGLAATVEVQVENSSSLSNGDVKFIYAEKVKGEKGQALTVPGGFVVGLPVFEGDTEVHALPVRLRFRVREGEVTWTLVPLGADDVVRAAVDAARARVAAEVGCEVFEGLPEA